MPSTSVPRVTRPVGRLLLAGALAAVGLTACSSDEPAAGAIALTATDSACEVARTDLAAGNTTFAISNEGNKVTEVYVYAQSGEEFSRVVTEKENIGPGTVLRPDRVAASRGPTRSPASPARPATASASRSPSPSRARPVEDPQADQAVAAYRAYVQQQADALIPLVDEFVAAVKAGDVAKAKELYAPSRVPWEAVEPVAESFGDLDPRVDLREADLEEGQEWTGWHRIEKALWTDGNLDGMAPVADQLAADVRELQAKVPTAEMSVASVGNGAKELLDEVATGKITGEEEAFSHTDLVDFQANLDGAQQGLRRPAPAGRRTPSCSRPSTPRSRRSRTSSTCTAAGTGFVSYETVDEPARRELSRVVDGLGEPLSQLTAAAV